jgi:putative ABC transport system permease protein
VQLTVVALVVAVVLRHLALSAAFVTFMFGVATFTATRRLRAPRTATGWVALAILAGAGPVVAIALVSGVVPLVGAAVIPIAGIVIGNAMTVASSSGRRALDELTAHHDLYEAALALGLTDAVSRDLVVRPTAREALLPAIDQTRTVGLVTLPGAFVGVILGGGTPAQAAAAQVLVLVGVVTAQALTAAVVLRLVVTGRLRRARFV